MDLHNWALSASDKSEAQGQLAYFNDFEKSPFCNLIVSDQADKISPIKLISTSDLSAITQLQTSIPDAIAEGVATPKGKATK